MYSGSFLLINHRFRIFDVTSIFVHCCLLPSSNCHRFCFCGARRLGVFLYEISVEYITRCTAIYHKLYHAACIAPYIVTAGLGHLLQPTFLFGLSY